MGSASAIDRETRAQFTHAPVHLALDFAIVLRPVLGEAVENVRDHVADVAELRLAEAAGRARWRADADAAGFHRRQRVERNAVLVAGDARMLETLVGILAGEAERPEIDQREV